MARTAMLNLRIEPNTKSEAEELFGSFGLTVTDAVNVFLHQSLMRGGFPFEIIRYKPNMITQAAIEESMFKLNETVKEMTEKITRNVSLTKIIWVTTLYGALKYRPKRLRKRMSF